MADLEPNEVSMPPRSWRQKASVLQMPLVRMLNVKNGTSWAQREEICAAIGAIQDDAESMDRERMHTHIQTVEFGEQKDG